MMVNLAACVSRKPTLVCCFLITTALLLSALSTATQAPQEKPGEKKEYDFPKTKEEWDEAMERHAEQSKQVFELIHCPKSIPEVAAAFKGCWRVASVWAAPTERNLVLGMRASEDKFQLWLDSHSAKQGANSQYPRYCSPRGSRTVAPYPFADFSKSFTYIYTIADIPPEIAGDLARKLHPVVEDRVALEEYQFAVIDFTKKGGKYIRTLINMGPTHVWWDSDAEEDFWAFPASCEGWEEIEKKLEPFSAATAAGSLLPNRKKQETEQRKPEK